MGHAQRFDAVHAQKGTPLHTVATGLKALAGLIEEWFDANSAEVVSAMQHFEQGLARLSTAPAAAEEPESDDSGEVPGGDSAKLPEKPSAPKATRRTSQKAQSDPTE